MAAFLFPSDYGQAGEPTPSSLQEMPVSQHWSVYVFSLDMLI